MFLLKCRVLQVYSQKNDWCYRHTCFPSLMSDSSNWWKPQLGVKATSWPDVCGPQDTVAASSCTNRWGWMGPSEPRSLITQASLLSVSIKYWRWFLAPSDCSTRNPAAQRARSKENCSHSTHCGHHSLGASNSLFPASSLTAAPWVLECSRHWIGEHCQDMPLPSSLVLCLCCFLNLVSLPLSMPFKAQILNPVCTLHPSIKVWKTTHFRESVPSDYDLVQLEWDPSTGGLCVKPDYSKEEPALNSTSLFVLKSYF